LRIQLLFHTSAFAVIFACAGCGSSTKSALSSNLSPAKIPFGTLDNPLDGATVKGAVLVDGWALSEGGVDHVAIYIDRTYLQDAPVKGAREDVAKVYPQFASVLDMRFSTEFHAETIAPGPHQISARVIGRDGATRDLPPHTITVEH